MGIPYYFHTLYKKYANAKLMVNESEIASHNIDHLFLDYNSMIHPCAQQVLCTLTADCTMEKDFIEEQIMRNTITYTRYIVDLLRPKNVYIMIDGVAPRAKINQQRERRYKSYFVKKLAATVVQWDSNKITPGTGFMAKLRTELDIFKMDYAGVSDCNIHISDSDECGEGEHKMMKYISDKLSEGIDRICIYGLDADLIMLSLLNIKRDNIILIRDNTFNEKLKESERTFTYLDICKLGGAIYLELNNAAQSDDIAGGLVKNRLINDYIFLCFMLGNDFMEHIPSLIIRENGVGILTKYYISALKKHNSPNNNSETVYLTDNNKPLQERINLPMLVDILGQLSGAEDYFFKRILSVYKGNGIVYKDISLDAENDSQLYLLQQDVIKFNKSGYKERYYEYYGISELDKTCLDYIEGLYWIYGYYNNHEHSNWSWYYKHHATPFVSDLYNFLRKHTKYVKEVISETRSLHPSNPNSTLQQLFMVLPRDSLIDVLEDASKTTNKINVQVNKIKRLFRTQSDVLEKYYPTRITLDMINREWIWQSKVFFDNFDKEIIELIL